MNWHKDLAAARTCDEVIALANDYFAEACPALADRMPETAMPAAVASVSELHAAQRRLVDAFMANPVFALDTEIQDACVFAIRALARGLELAEDDPHHAMPAEAGWRASSFDDRAEL